MKKNLYLIPAMLVPFIASIFYFYIFKDGIIAQTIYLFAKIFILIYPLFFIKKSDPLKEAFRFNSKEAFLGLIIGIILFIFGYALIQIPQIWQEIKTAAPFIKTKTDAFGISEHYLLMVIALSFFHSMLEEYYWRWFVFGASKQNIISAVAFSLHHFTVLNFYFSLSTTFILSIAMIGSGLMFNTLYNRKKNVWGAWTTHVFADLFIFYVGFLLLNG